MYIVVKQRNDGTIMPGTPAFVHTDYEAAKTEAERLAASQDAKAYFVFKAFSSSQRTAAPVETKFV